MKLATIVSISHIVPSVLASVFQSTLLNICFVKKIIKVCHNLENLSKLTLKLSKIDDGCMS